MMILETMSWLMLLVVSVQLLGRAICQQLNLCLAHCSTGFVHAVVGLAALIMLAQLLLFVQGLYVWSVLLGLWLPIIWLRPVITWPDKQLALTFLRQHWILLLLLMLHFIPEALLLFKPESQHDALSYHLPYARLMAEQHGLLVNEYLRYPLNVFNINALFAVGMLFDGEILARALNTWMTLLLIIGVYVFSLQQFNKLTALLASWGMMSTNMVTNLMTAAYVDLGVALWVFATVLFLIHYQQHRNPAALWLSALAFGLALGSKYLVLMLLPMYVVALWLTRPPARLFRQVLVASLLIGCTWYLRNLMIAGNPVHPFAQAWFGFWLWTPADLVAQQQDILQVHGVSRTLEQLVQLPWLFHQGAFNKHGTVHLLLVLGLAGIPLGLLFKGVVRWISVFCLLNVVLWFYSSQIARYLFYLFPWLVILSACLVSWLVLRVSKPLMKPALLSQVQPVVTVLAVVLLIAGAHKTVRYVNKLVDQQRIATNQADWLKLKQQDPVYQLVQIANKEARLGTFVLSATATQHHFTGVFKGDWYGPANMRDFVSQLTAAGQPEALLATQQTDLLLVSRHVKQFDGPVRALSGSLLEPIADNEFGVLYRLKTIEKSPAID
jgi:hypothetical protein